MIDLLGGLEAFRRYLDYAQQLNLNMVRFPLLEMSTNPNLSMAQYRTHMNQFLDTLEVLLPEIDAKGLKVIIDMHHPVGGILNGRWRIFRSSDGTYREFFKTYWVEIGKRFDSNPTVAAYELLNEPGDRKSKIWNKLAKETQARMRSEGILKTTIVMHNHDDPYNMRYLKPVSEWSIYAFHLYHPKDITLQGAGYNVGKTYSKTQSYIESKISRALRFRDKYNFPLICTEFGCARKSGWSGKNNQLFWLDDTLQVFKKHGIGWVYNYATDVAWDMWSPIMPWDPNEPQIPNINSPAATLLKVWQ